MRGDEEEAMARAVQEHGSAAVTEGMVALIARMVDLMSRIIGEELAIRMVEQVGVPSPIGIPGPDLFGAHDG